MECERIREEFVERLTGTLDPERSAAIDRHVAGCEACRAETERMREMWTELGALRAAPTVGAGRARVERLIAGRAAGAAGDTAPGGGTRRRNVLTVLGMAATLLIGVALGREARPSTAIVSREAAGPATISTEPRFLLLLHGPAASGAPPVTDSAATRAVVEEYRAWAGRLRSAGMLVSAEKLANEPLVVLTRDSAYVPPRFTADEIGGFFLIQAADSAAAYRVARESPHLKYGGTVQLRRIDPT